MTGFQFLDGVERNIENGLDYRPLRCYDNNFIIFIEKSRSDTRRIAEDECVAMTKKSGHRISAVPTLGRPAKDSGNVEFLGNSRRCFAFGKSGFSALLVQISYLIVQEMSDFLHHRNGIRNFFWMLAKFNQTRKKFLYIGHVKVTGYDQVSMHPIVLTQKRVNAFNAVFPESPVSDVSQKDLTDIRYFAFPSGDIVNKPGILCQ